jgi:hypothetical protein
MSAPARPAGTSACFHAPSETGTSAEEHSGAARPRAPPGSGRRYELYFREKQQKVSGKSRKDERATTSQLVRFFVSSRLPQRSWRSGWCRSVRLARPQNARRAASGPVVDPPLTSRRRYDELERDMQVFPARRVSQRGVVSVQPSDGRAQVYGVHVLSRGELRVRG